MKVSGALILMWLWGAITMAGWFLAFVPLGDKQVPNPFLALGIISTVVFILFAIANVIKDL